MNELSLEQEFVARAWAGELIDAVTLGPNFVNRWLREKDVKNSEIARELYIGFLLKCLEATNYELTVGLIMVAADFGWETIAKDMIR